MVQLSSSLPHSLRGELYPECKSKFPKLMWPRRSLPSRNTQPVSIHQPLPLTHGLSEGLLPLPWNLCPTVTTMSMSVLSKAVSCQCTQMSHRCPKHVVFCSSQQARVTILSHTYQSYPPHSATIPETLTRGRSWKCVGHSHSVRSAVYTCASP